MVGLVLKGLKKQASLGTESIHERLWYKQQLSVTKRYLLNFRDVNVGNGYVNQVINLNGSSPTHLIVVHNLKLCKNHKQREH